MPIRLSDLAAKTRTVTVDFEGTPIEVTYLPGRMTMATQQRLQKSTELPAGKANRELATILAELVAGWDVTDDNGAPLPVTEELVRQLPLRFVTALTTELFEDINPNEGKIASS